MSCVKWALLQIDVWIVSGALHQMRLKAMFQNHMTLVVRTDDRIVVAWQLGAHFYAKMKVVE